MDAHHIMERRLFPDGGYYLANGASVCAAHHIACEQTLISTDQVRQACGITRKIIPPHLYADQPYDKWGNPVLANGRRVRGELFLDESVQKALAPVLDLFTQWVKYPRTYHLPWSQGLHSDDRVMTSVESLLGRRVVVTEKLDGENTTFYTDYLHARSVDGRSHPSRDWVKQFWSQICADIPPGWRICGENLYAQHSIAYQDLESYFYGLSIWDERNTCLDWDQTLQWFELLGITPVPVLYDGVFDETAIKALWDERHWSTREGYIVRDAGQIGFSHFQSRVGKFVRKNHVQTIKHWMYGQPVIPNTLKRRVDSHGKSVIMKT